MNQAAARGQAAEAAAGRALEAAGLRILDRNARSRRGELDLVALERDVLVVVEVRARGHSRFASAAESVDARKQARIIAATQAWLAAHPAHARRVVRFDVMTFDGDAETPTWWRAAFDASNW